MSATRMRYRGSKEAQRSSRSVGSLILPRLLKPTSSQASNEASLSCKEPEETPLRSAVLADYHRIVNRPKKWQERCRIRGKRYCEGRERERRRSWEEGSSTAGVSVASEAGSQFSKDSFISWFDDLFTLEDSVDDSVQGQREACRRLFRGGSSLTMLPKLCAAERRERVIEEERRSWVSREEDEGEETMRLLREYRQGKISKTEQVLAAKLLTRASFTGVTYDPAYAVPIKAPRSEGCFISLKPGIHFHIVLASVFQSLRHVRMPTTLFLGVADIVRREPESNGVEACLISARLNSAELVVNPTDLPSVQRRALEMILVDEEENRASALPLAVCKRVSSSGGGYRSILSFMYTVEQLQEEIEKAALEKAPVAFQKFIKAKGRQPWMLRICWSRTSGCVKAWMLTSTTSYFSSEKERLPTAEVAEYRLVTCSSRVDRCSIVELRPSVWNEPCVLTEELAAVLRQTLNLPLDEMVVDFIQDDNCAWWLLQVKAFRLDSKEMESASHPATGSLLVPKKGEQHPRPVPPVVPAAEPAVMCRGALCPSPEERCKVVGSILYRKILFHRVYESLNLTGKVKASTLEGNLNARELREQFTHAPVCHKCNKVYQHVERDILIEPKSRSQASSHASKRTDAACARLYDDFQRSVRRKSEPLLALLEKEEGKSRELARRRRWKKSKTSKKKQRFQRTKEKATFYDLHPGDRVVLVDTSNAGTVLRCDGDKTRVTVKFDDGYTVDRIERSLLICKEKHLTNDFKLSADELISVGAVPPTSTYEFNREGAADGSSEDDSDSSCNSARDDYADDALRIVDEELYSSQTPSYHKPSIESAEEGIYCPFGCGLRLKADSQSLRDAHTIWKTHMEECSKRYSQSANT